MTVYFVSAGPGAPDLITLRAKAVIEQCTTILYAGSLIPEAVLDFAPAAAHKINTATLSRTEIFAHFKRAQDQSSDIARLHSGDVSLYSAMTEQIDYLKEHQIPFEIIPGVPSFAAAAASFGVELTKPGLAQSLILTRTAKNATPLPIEESLANFARTKATIALHLSAKNAAEIMNELTPYYGEDCPVFIAVEVSWPSERLVKTRLGDLLETIEREKIKRTAIIFIGRALEKEALLKSKLYEQAPIQRIKSDAGG